MPNNDVLFIIFKSGQNHVEEHKNTTRLTGCIQQNKKMKKFHQKQRRSTNR